ncbi:DEAD/DEAH box helicase family protein [Hungatella hathewayi]|uniref:DEAD/DEAH box helicase n=1 Tax=Hungatella hathewayi TaxID=154046 RepID=UPI00210B6EA0|nr:DEAD/DEAH box helicase family protein [Hungatella hathewayi]MCQ5384697.1 DEAD/DEAH box helicase family protein [Hungatella hathewayi]
MELKTYQKKVMSNLSSYLDCVDRSDDLFKAWKDYWEQQDIHIGFGGVPSYKNAIVGVPHICMKVPTGGGKTFMACASIKKIFDTMPLDKPRVVVWLVPSDPILMQTIRTLSDVNHPYRQKLDADFAGRVGVYTKEMLLNGQGFSPDTVREMLTICILSYGSLRIDSRKKEVRKVYQENGYLLRFAEYFKNDDVLLADTPETALIQVLRHLFPITIVDESHNAGSDLSVEMLSNLNPSLVLDLTATPRKNSNIISYVDARELKKENMVKLPVVVYNRTKRQSVIQDAIQLRGSIEQQAIAEEQAGGHYIRPIVLFQAQPKTNDDSETFDKIKTMLVDMGIPEKEIAIKTSKVDDLGKTDLMSRDCEIRYIITVNALKEGWDCPFAYILASLANKTSSIDIEQILGRILRQPYTKQHSAPLLNTSYVLTCSNDFHNTLENIVIGLNKAGFSRKDFRVGEVGEAEEISKTTVSEVPYQQMEMPDEEYKQEEIDTFEDIVTEEVRNALETSNKNVEPIPDIVDMIQEASKQAEEYNDAIADTIDSGMIGGELGDMLQQNEIQIQFREEAKKISVPQFFLKTVPDLFGDEYELLEPENLSEGFSLSGQDSTISFELATGEMYKVDVQEQGEAVPKYKRVSKSESEYLREYLAKLPPEKKIEQCTDMICRQINKNNRYATADISDYVRRIISNMSDDELTAMETAIPVYANKIQKKIVVLENKYREQQFFKWIDSGKIVCRDSYVLPDVITPAYTTDSIPYSLYEAEKDDMNNFEHSLIDVIVGFENIKWWHRIIERKGLRLNGFINHYPDFMVMTKAGKIVLIEAKGDYLDGDDSKSKLRLGRKWAEQAGRIFRYFMVFKDKDLGMDGAYTLDKFADIMKEL